MSIATYKSRDVAEHVTQYPADDAKSWRSQFTLIFQANGSDLPGNKSAGMQLLQKLSSEFLREVSLWR